MGMKMMGYVKSFPVSALFYVLPIVIMIFSIAFTTYQTNLLKQRRFVLDEAAKSIPSCVLQTYEKKELSEAILARNKLIEYELLKINKVTNRKDLYSLPVVVICE